MDKISNVCKFQDIVQSGINFFFGKSDHGSIQIHIFKTGIFHIKSGTQFQQCGNSSVYFYLSFCRSQNTCDDFQNGGLTGTIGSDNAHTLAFTDIKIHIVQCIMLFIKFLSGKPQSLFESVRRLII